MSKDEKKIKKNTVKSSEKKATKKVEKKKAEKKVSKKKAVKKTFEVPEVLRPDSLATVVQMNVLESEDASEKVKALPKKDLKFLIENMVASILGHLENEGKFQYMPFITLEPKVRLPRKGRNPQTGAPLDIKGSRYVSFRSGKGLKDLMNKDADKVKKAIAEAKAAKEAKEAKAKAKAKDSKKSLKKKSA